MDKHNNRFPFAHTFSIVARDPQTGQMGAGVQSHWFSVGSIVTWAEAGVGAVATQSMVEPSYGPLGLALMKAGKSPQEALNGLLAADNGCSLRQVAMVDAQGRVATHTGARCIAEAGHIQGEGFSVQANMMLNDRVWPAMDAAYRSASGDLAARILAALRAGQDAGGDVRGQQSAAILIVSAQSTGRPWADRVMDLRVEDHPDPIGELARLVDVHRAYTFMNQGDEELGTGRVDEALKCYRAAAQLAPDITELPFWQAVSLADLGRVEDALPILRRVFAADPNLALLLRRLPAAGLLNASEDNLALLLAAAAGSQ